MSFRVTKVKTSRERKAFIDFPYKFYKDSAFWVPPLRMDQKGVLNPKKNPFFEHGDIELFIAHNEENDEIVGRIAAIKNGMHLEKYNDGVGFFGFYECIENIEAARSLFTAAAQSLKDSGLKTMRGPTNPSMNDISGMLVDGFDKLPAIMMPYNMSYYPQQLADLGFEKEMTMWAYFIRRDTRKMERMHRGLELLKRRYPDLSVRTLDMKRFDEEARTILAIYNDAWQDNWGHVTMTENEFLHLVKDMKQIVDPNIVYLLEKAGETIGFSISLPDINPVLHRIKNGKLFPFGLLKLFILPKLNPIVHLRTLLMGIKKEHQGKGWDALMNASILIEGPKHGYTGSEMSWILESNPKMKLGAENVGGYKVKEYAMFEHSRMAELLN